MIISGKRKTAVAKAVLRSGAGKITFNNYPLNLVNPETARMKLMEPLIVAGEKAKNIDIKIKAQGGGVISQAEAARLAIARGLIKWTKSAQLKRALRNQDRAMLAGDPRRAESKKFGGPSARTRKQKSYR
ncbi:30S ribosomal protein S9 [Candidatus Bathyarchaeota archaeon RBG_13_38_9]|nr:MAG: 30S ribosomal protein S9 [Candidatus Bathyarchaeota archaeon RBG_13_38_9]